jgi:hypothetical protein
MTTQGTHTPTCVPSELRPPSAGLFRQTFEIAGEPGRVPEPEGARNPLSRWGPLERGEDGSRVADPRAEARVNDPTGTAIGHPPLTDRKDRRPGGDGRTGRGRDPTRQGEHQCSREQSLDGAESSLRT